MAKIKGKCHNYDGCDMAEKEIIQEVDESNFVCEECGKQLYQITSSNSPSKAKWIILCAVVLCILGGGAYALFGDYFKKENIITLNEHIKNIDVQKVKSDTLIATVSPSDADINWISSNDNLLTVDNGIVSINEEGEGEVIVYAQINDSDIKDSCIYHLEKQTDYIHKIEKFDISNNKITTSPGTIVHINCKPMPTDASESYKFTSADEKIALVSEEGDVKALKEGKTTISVISDCGNAKSDVVVLVRNIVKVSNPNYGTINLGYGIYTGDLKNGEPHGHGTIKYKSSHQIVSSKDFIANAGDEFEGDFRNGMISGNIGYWKHNGDITGIKP